MAKTKAKKRVIAKKSPATRGPGKPKRVFTDAQLEEMAGYALAGCQTKTIANLMGIPRETIDQRRDIQQLLTKKRSQRKLKLLRQQNKSAEKGTPVMLIWLGKNVLDQKDHVEKTVGVTDALADLMKDIGNNGKGLPIQT